jgi:hypothetical protein
MCEPLRYRMLMLLFTAVNEHGCSPARRGELGQDPATRRIGARVAAGGSGRESQPADRGGARGQGPERGARGQGPERGARGQGPERGARGEEPERGAGGQGPERGAKGARDRSAAPRAKSRSAASGAAGAKRGAGRRLEGDASAGGEWKATTPAGSECKATRQRAADRGRRVSRRWRRLLAIRRRR